MPCDLYKPFTTQLRYALTDQRGTLEENNLTSNEALCICFIMQPLCTPCRISDTLLLTIVCFIAILDLHLACASLKTAGKLCYV